MRMDVLDILRKTGNYGIDAVIQLLYHPSEDIRVYGCEVLRDLKHPSSLPHLLEKVYEQDENVKNAAVTALGGFDDPRAIDALLDGAQSGGVGRFLGHLQYGADRQQTDRAGPHGRVYASRRRNCPLRRAKRLWAFMTTG